jgi:hypothetical protein
MGLMGKIARAADRVTNSWSTRAAINHMFLKGIGTMTQLKIDAKAKTLEAELSLEGEVEPIKIFVGRYEIEKLADGAAMITLSEVKVSRGWMQELVKRLVEGKPQRVGADYAGYLGMLM